MNEIIRYSLATLCFSASIYIISMAIDILMDIFNLKNKKR